MNTTLLRTALLSFVLFAPSLSIQAQNSSPDAHLSGRVTDASGYTIAGVGIIAQSQDSAIPAASTSTAADGTFNLILTPGRYRHPDA